MAADTDIRGPTHPARRAAQARSPTGPGVYLFRDARGQGHLRRQGQVDPQARRQPLLQPGHARRRTRWSTRSTTIEFLARRHRGRGAAHRAELHQAVPAALQHPPARRQVLSVHRDLDWTRTSRASTSRASATGATAPTSGPYSNAKRVRGTLDLLGKIFLFRSCEGAEPGRRSRLAVPGLLHQALRGALRRLRRQGGVPRGDRRRRSRSSPAATARSSATSRSG